MSEQEFESYIRLMGRFLRLSDSQRNAIGRELRDHMEERLEELLHRGHTRDEAIQIALDEFGDAAALAAEFRRIGRKRKWIMRTTAGTLGIAATVLIVSFLLPENRSAVPSPALTHAGQTDTAKPPTPEIPVFVPSQDTTKPDVLAKTVPELSFQTTPLDAALEFLADQGLSNMVVRWNILETAGIDRQMEISLALKDIRLGTALRMLLDSISPDLKLGYAVEDGVVVISTQEDLDTRTVVRVYDCRSLLDRPLTEAQQALLLSMVADSSGTRARFLPPTTQPTVRQGLPSERAFQGLDQEERKAAKVIETLRKRNAEDLVKLICDTLASPDHWREGGGVGCISEYDGLIVINDTLTVHQQVTDLLAMLQRARESRVAMAGHSKTAQ